MKVLLDKLKETLSAVAPIVALVLVLHFTLVPVPGNMLVQFIIGAVFIILGLTILLFGIEIGITPFGEHIGKSFLKSNKLWYVVFIGFLFGFFINIAEPDFHVLAAQVASVTGGHIPMFVILVAVSIGTGIMLSIGVARIVKGFPLNMVYIVTYGIIAILALFSSSDMLAIGFDASGATTGALTVPFVLALSAGAANMKKNSKTAEEDSFGLVGVMSTGAILGVLLLNMVVKTDNVSPSIAVHGSNTGSIFAAFMAELPIVAKESLIALFPIVVLFLIFQRVNLHVSKRAFIKIIQGFAYTYLGLILFLTGVKAGFMNVGNFIGHGLGSLDNKGIVVGMGFLLGMLVILTEPAVYVLTQQIESVTNGYIRRKTVLVTMSIGVAVAVGLSMLRIVVPQIQLWHYLLPGFGLSMLMTFFVPKLFVGIAFDSGGVASGPMTATFVLAFAQGVSESIEYSNVLVDSFGVIAMVAMTPLIALQILGLIYKVKTRKSGVK